jgi:predicted SnoaL-like aldol condensation-catalyzing enzyme
MDYPRGEVEAAFAEFLRRGVGTHDWPGWAAVFTDDARYIEHNLGRFTGAAEIRDWIVPTMADFPSMTLWVEWSMIEGNRVVFYIWNNLPDPSGQGRNFQFPNATALEYAGGGLWKYEEDFYNPVNAQQTVVDWLKAGGTKATAPDRSLQGIPDWAPDPPAAHHPRDEVEAAFHRYVERGRKAVATGDWDQWADQFTPDARYFEHHYGKFNGQAQIRDWITSVMQPFPSMEFPVDWYLIDGNRVAMLCQNRLPDPRGGDAVYEFPTLVVLHYAGDDRWSYEEDIYNPAEAPPVIEAWTAAGGTLPEGFSPPA